MFPPFLLGNILDIGTPVSLNNAISTKKLTLGGIFGQMHIVDEEAGKESTTEPFRAKGSSNF